MSLQEDFDALETERKNLFERLQKLEERRDKVRPELFDKLYGELNDKLNTVEASRQAVEQQIEEERRRREEEERQRLEEERRRLEEERQRLEEERRRLAEERRREEEQKRLLTVEQRQQRVLEKYVDELQARKRDWQLRQEASCQEMLDHATSLRKEREGLEEKSAVEKNNLDELELRNEIGEFEDDPSAYERARDLYRSSIEGYNAQISAVDNELGLVTAKIEQINCMQPPDFAEEILAEHESELQEQEVYEPEEEVYTPDAGTVISEEEISGEALAEGEQLITEVEEVYEDETEEAFFASRHVMSVPSLVEKLADGQKIHELILGGAKTMIGSDESCEVYLPYASVERRHAWIKVDRKAQYLIKDLGSKTGTYVNGKKINKTYLQNGDQIRVGEIKLVVKLS